MTGAIPALDEDFHVHSTYSADAVSTIGENLAAAADRELRTICLAEHVRADSSHVPEFAAAAAASPRPPGLRVLTGAEVKILDMTGRLDVPPDLAGIDVLLIADHQFPADLGPVDPAAVRAAIAGGEVPAQDAIECLAEATANAAGTGPDAVIAHMFSVLPKIGLAEDDVPDRQLAWLADRIAAAGRPWRSTRSGAALARARCARCPALASGWWPAATATTAATSAFTTRSGRSPTKPGSTRGAADGAHPQVAAGLARAGGRDPAGRGQLSVPAGRPALPAAALRPVQALVPAHGDPDSGLERGRGHRGIGRPADAA